MIRTLIFVGASALVLAPAAMAERGYNYGYGHNQGGYGVQHAPVQANPCEAQRDSNRVLGGVIGAVAGGALGVAIADNNDPDNITRRGYSGGRGYYGGRGYSGGRGYYGGRGHRGHSDNENGNEIAGALIGGVLGAVIGSELAGSGTDCSNRVQRYTDMGVPAPTREPYGPAWNSQAPTSVYGSTGQQVTYQTAPQTVYSEPVYSEPVYTSTTRSYGTVTTAPTTVSTCRTVQRETRMPDGSLVREPVDVCQGADGRWEMTDTLYGY